MTTQAYPGTLVTKSGQVIKGQFRLTFNPNAHGLALYLASLVEELDEHGNVTRSYERKSFTFYSENGYPHTVGLDNFGSFLADVNA